MGETTGPVRYDLNQIPYEYTVEVTNRFRGSDLVKRVPEELWTEVCNIIQEAVNKTIPKKKQCKKAICLSKDALQIAEERREAKSKGERERYTHLTVEFWKIARGDLKAFFNGQCKEVEENSRKGKTRDLFKKIGNIKGTCCPKMGTIKDGNGKDLLEAEEIKKRLKEYTVELYRKDLNDLDNHDSVVSYSEPDILEREVKWALGSTAAIKASRKMEFQQSYLKS